jgi:hypothetical protein
MTSLLPGIVWSAASDVAKQTLEPTGHAIAEP